MTSGRLRASLVLGYRRTATGRATVVGESFRSDGTSYGPSRPADARLGCIAAEVKKKKKNFPNSAEVFAMCRRLILAAMACWTVAGEVIDLSHGHVSGAIDCWLPDERFVIFGHRIETGPDGWYSTAKFSMSEHCGTHVDAPFHVDFNRWKLDQIPLDHMVADGIVHTLFEYTRNRRRGQTIDSL